MIEAIGEYLIIVLLVSILITVVFGVIKLVEWMIATFGEWSLIIFPMIMLIYLLKKAVFD